MSRPADHDPRLLDYLGGELPAEDAAALEAEMAADPALAAAHDRWAALTAAEAEAFVPAATRATLAQDAPRMAAWIRATVRDEERAQARQPAAATHATPTRGWARVFAFSVAVHVVALGVLALVLGGDPDEDSAGGMAQVGWTDIDNVEDLPGHDRERLTDVQWREIVYEDLGAQLDEVAMMEQERLPEEISRFESEPTVGWGAPEYPHRVTVAMLRRKREALKRRRLDILGFNSQGTLTAVARGLEALSHRQSATDGMFRSAGASPSVATTALATLTFLGEGHASNGQGEYDRVVGRAVGALRKHAASPASIAALSSVEVGTLAVALCEDYMLSYGGLTVRGAASRSAEIVRLADVARTRAASADGKPTDRSWLVWALDAAHRAGVLPASPQDRAQFDGWVVSTADPAAGDAEDAQAALSVGMALLYAERGSEKPRFMTWSEANAERLLARLKPTGVARKGDEVRDTALILLALQVSYRAY